MSLKRRDNKNRILNNGESQRKDGRYVYKYIDSFGKEKFIYAWKLVSTDRTPKGKREDKSLREKEQEILKDISDGINPTKMTVCQLYSKKISLRPNVKDSTKIGRDRLMKSLEEDKIGSCVIGNVKMSDAKEFVIRLKAKGIAYQTIKNDKRSLKASFIMAIQDDCIRKNPFDFKLDEVIENDTEKPVPLAPKQEESLYSFIESDKTYSKNYDEVILLRETGLRISEFCGLIDTDTYSDFDFENRLINVERQLLRNTEQGYYIDDTKTDTSVRKVPMSDKAFEILKRISNRKNKNTITIDGYSGFLFLKRNGYPMICSDYDSIFKGIAKKYNKCHEEKLPKKMTPHILRHTFCTDLANKGMNPKALQYIMGHKNILTTLNYYVHATFNSAKIEMERVLNQNFYYPFTTFKDENIRIYESICEHLPNNKNVVNA